MLIIFYTYHRIYNYFELIYWQNHNTTTNITVFVQIYVLHVRVTRKEFQSCNPQIFVCRGNAVHDSTLPISLKVKHWYAIFAILGCLSSWIIKYPQNLKMRSLLTMLLFILLVIMFPILLLLLIFLTVDNHNNFCLQFRWN